VTSRWVNLPVCSTASNFFFQLLSRPSGPSEMPETPPFFLLKQRMDEPSFARAYVPYYLQAVFAGSPNEVPRFPSCTSDVLFYEAFPWSEKVSPPPNDLPLLEKKPLKIAYSFAPWCSSFSASFLDGWSIPWFLLSRPRLTPNILPSSDRKAEWQAFTLRQYQCRRFAPYASSAWTLFRIHSLGQLPPARKSGPRIPITFSPFVCFSRDFILDHDPLLSVLRDCSA